MNNTEFIKKLNNTEWYDENHKYYFTVNVENMEVITNDCSDGFERRMTMNNFV